MEAGATGATAAAAAAVAALAAAAARTSKVAAGAAAAAGVAAAAGSAAASARPSGRSRRNLCRVHSGIRKQDCMDSGGPQNHRYLHIFRCSRERYHRRVGTCSRTRTILLQETQETAAAVSEEESEAVEAVEAVEAEKCTGDHSRCNRCQEDIGSGRCCTRSLALRRHKCQHRMTGRGYKNSNSLNSRMNCMCSGTQLQVVKAVAQSSRRWQRWRTGRWMRWGRRIDEARSAVGAIGSERARRVPFSSRTSVVALTVA